MAKDEYFGMLLKMLDKYAQPQEGEIFFSPADLAKLPDGFAGKVEEAAKKKGGSLKISKESGRTVYVKNHGNQHFLPVSQGIFKIKLPCIYTKYLISPEHRISTDQIISFFSILV